MSFNTLTSFFLLVLSSIVLAQHGRFAASKYVQSPRDIYQGGWPLGVVSGQGCPSSTPVTCTNVYQTTTCCPSGQFCFGSSNKYCCPTDVDCGPTVTTLPVCAVSTWNMFSLGESSPNNFVCCSGSDQAVLLGQVPGLDGALCEPNNQTIPTSALATMVSQIGGTPVPPTATSSNSSPAYSTPGNASSSGDWSIGGKAGIGAGGFFGLIIVIMICYCLCKGDSRHEEVWETRRIR